MHPRLKSLLFVALALFMLFAVVKSPERTADLLAAFWDVVTNAASGIMTFIRSLLA